MKTNYLKFKVLLAIALFVSIAANAQLSYTFAYTGAVQTVTLPAGFWGIKCWGANGGNVTAGPGGGGKGGYTEGSYNVTTPGTLLFIYVGGKGVDASGSGSPPGAGGWNGGGGGAMVGRSGAGGGGATDVRVGGTAAGNRVIVAGGGGGAAYYNLLAAGGNGGGIVAQSGDIISSANVVTTGGGGAGANGATPGIATVGTANGTATGGGGGGSAAGSSIGQPGIGGGQGGTAGPSGSGSTGSAAGGGGGYAGGAGGVQTVNSGVAGGGGSSYIGGVTSATTIMFGQSGFPANPDVTGNGRVIITELCNITLVASNSTLSSSSNPVICAGESLTLTTSAVNNYSWSTGSTSSSLVIAPATNTVYTLTALSPSNCTTSRTISVTVSGGQPTIAVASTTNEVCLGRTVTFTASGAVTYTWSNNITNGVPFIPSATNTYTVSGQNGCGTATAVTAVSVSPLPVTVVSNPTVVCPGVTSTISATAAATTYTWFPVPSSISSVVVSPQANTVYTVAVSDGTCSGLGTVAVNALPGPTISAGPSLTTVCSGVPVTFSASGGVSYLWILANQPSSTFSVAGSTFTTAPLVPTAYQVIGSNSLGCTSIANVAVNANPSPTITLLTTSNLICVGDPVDILASGATSYTWNNGANTTSISVSPSVTTVYTITGELNTCISTETVSVVVFIPTLSISGNTAICVGESATLTASSANTYLWNNGMSNPSILVSPVTSSIYSVSALTASSGINCPSSSSIQVIVNPRPILTMVAAKSSMCRNESNTISVSGANTYTWDNGANGTSIVITSSLVTTLNFSVIGTSSLNCTNSAAITVKISNCSGIDEMSKSQNSLLIYPNPNSGAFKVKGLEAMELQLLNEVGQLILDVKLNSNNNYEMYFDHLASGVYFIVGSTTNGSVNQKLIVIEK